MDSVARFKIGAKFAPVLHYLQKATDEINFFLRLQFFVIKGVGYRIRDEIKDLLPSGQAGEESWDVLFDSSKSDRLWFMAFRQFLRNQHLMIGLHLTKDVRCKSDRLVFNHLVVGPAKKHQVVIGIEFLYRVGRIVARAIGT